MSGPDPIVILERVAHPADGPGGPPIYALVYWPASGAWTLRPPAGATRNIGPREAMGLVAARVTGLEFDNQQELARTIGVNPRTVRRWASGETAPPAAMVGYMRELCASMSRRGGGGV